jgi:hypothetical protein
MTEKCRYTFIEYLNYQFYETFFIGRGFDRCHQNFSKFYFALQTGNFQTFIFLLIFIFC